MQGSAAVALPISIIAVLVGILIIVVGALSWRGRLRRGRLVGIRTPASVSSDAAFAAANRAGGPLIVAGGVVALLGGLVGLLVGLTVAGFAGLACAFAGIVLMGVLAALGGVVGSRAANRVNPPNYFGR
jgi:uncharacterized membrane protein